MNRNDNVRILKIGIASRDEMKARTMAIIRGDLRQRPDDPKIWFTSIESLAQVLSTKNRLLLELIQRTKPASMAELARMAGRQPSNLSRTLNTMARYQLVSIKEEGKRRIPVVDYDRIEVTAYDAMIASQALMVSKLVSCSRQMVP